MKTEKNSFSWKKVNFQIFKFILWISLGLIFISFSILVPTKLNDTAKELLTFLCLAIIVNVHTSYLFPTVYKKNKWLYIILFICSIIFCATFEILLFTENLFAANYNNFDNKKLFFLLFSYISIRDIAFFVFFIWIEYFNRIILLYYKQEKIHKKEISLLLEKKEFERTISRKKILPHYLFNILEHIYAKFLNNEIDIELLDKFKFILYYFLVDAELDIIELDKELVFYKYYIDLEKLRHQNQIVITMNILGKPEDYKIIPLLFESPIGNALKYTKHDGTGQVDITIDASKYPLLHFYCSNNYSSNSSNIISSENGLKIFEQRLKLCYNNKYSLKITQKDDLYTVKLSINVK